MRQQPGTTEVEINFSAVSDRMLFVWLKPCLGICLYFISSEAFHSWGALDADTERNFVKGARTDEGCLCESQVHLSSAENKCHPVGRKEGGKVRQFLRRRLMGVGHDVKENFECGENVALRVSVFYPCPAPLSTWAGFICASSHPVNLKEVTQPSFDDKSPSEGFKFQNQLTKLIFKFYLKNWFRQFLLLSTIWVVGILKIDSWVISELGRAGSTLGDLYSH